MDRYNTIYITKPNTGTNRQGFINQDINLARSFLPSYYIPKTRNPAGVIDGLYMSSSEARRHGTRFSNSVISPSDKRPLGRFVLIASTQATG